MEITKQEYDETVKYYKAIKKIPHVLMIECDIKSNLKFKTYEQLTDTAKEILNKNKKAR